MYFDHVSCVSLAPMGKSCRSTCYHSHAPPPRSITESRVHVPRRRHDLKNEPPRQQANTTDHPRYQPTSSEPPSISSTSVNASGFNLHRFVVSLVVARITLLETKSLFYDIPSSRIAAHNFPTTLTIHCHKDSNFSFRLPAQRKGNLSLRIVDS